MTTGKTLPIFPRGKIHTISVRTAGRPYPTTMDPFSSEGELLTIHTAFHQAQHSVVVDYDVSALSDSNKLAARVLQLRSRIALGQAADVLKEIEGSSKVELRAVAALAQQALGKGDAAVAAIKKILEEDGGKAAGNATVQVVGGTVLAAAGLGDDALNLLGKQEGNRKPAVLHGVRMIVVRVLIREMHAVDAVALIVQIHLQQNRNDLAVKEVTAARRWAQDSLLVNLAESWVGMRLVSWIHQPGVGWRPPDDCLRPSSIQGGEKYQQAFYVFEELAQAPSTSSVQTLVSQAVAELHLGRLEEAQAALGQAMKKDPNYAEAISNMLVLSVISGKDPKEYVRYVSIQPPPALFSAVLTVSQSIAKGEAGSCLLLGSGREVCTVRQGCVKVQAKGCRIEQGAQNSSVAGRGLRLDLDRQVRLRVLAVRSTAALDLEVECAGQLPSEWVKVQ